MRFQASDHDSTWRSVPGATLGGGIQRLREALVRDLGCLSIVTLGGAPGVLSPLGTCPVPRKGWLKTENTTE